MVIYGPVTAPLCSTLASCNSFVICIKQKKKKENQNKFAEHVPIVTENW